MASAADDMMVKVTSFLGLTNMTLTQPLPNGSDTTGVTPTLSPEDQALREHYMVTNQAIKQSYMWVIFAFGFPGNLMSLVIILRLRCFGSPALYVATLAVVDNMALVVKLLLLLFAEHKVLIGPMGCKVMFFLGNHLVVYANWVLVTMALERFVAVWQPLKLTRIWSTRKAAMSLAVVLLVTTAFTCPLFVTVTAGTNQYGKETCTIYQQYMAFMSVWQWGQVAAYGLLPCTLLLTLNILIIVIISRARRFQRSMTPSFKSNGSAAGANNDSHSSNGGVPGGGVQRQATVLLLVTSAVLVITTTPVCVYLLLQQWWDPDKGTVEFAKKQLVRTVLRAICDANHSVNFYLYFVSARKFRAYFCKAACWLCYRRFSRRDSDSASRHFSASRSTLRLKDRSRGHMLLFQRKKTVKDCDVDSENSAHMKLYPKEGANGCADTASSSPM